MYGRVVWWKVKFVSFKIKDEQQGKRKAIRCENNKTKVMSRLSQTYGIIFRNDKINIYDTFSCLIASWGEKALRLSCEKVHEFTNEFN